MPLEESQRLTLAGWPEFDAQQIDVVRRVLESGQVNYWTGSEGRLFEKEFARFCETRHAIAVANGSVALDSVLTALGIGDGDEVIVTPRSFMASASCVILAGAKPVFAEVDLDSQNVTAESIEAVLSPRTRAIVIVHLAGWPCEMEPIMHLAERYGVQVVEDCSQAHGATYQGRPVGSFSAAGVFSFCQDKIMTTGGEGGMIVTNDQTLWETMWSLKDHGKSLSKMSETGSGSVFRWVHDEIGTNWRLTEMQSAIGRVQLRRLPDWLSQRRANAQVLTERMEQMDLLRVTRPPAHLGHAYYKYYAFVRPDLLNKSWTRERVIDEIRSQGVPCFSGSCPEIYLEQSFQNRGLGPPQRLPNAKFLGETSLMFLCHPTMNEADMHRVCDIVSEVCADAKR